MVELFGSVFLTILQIFSPVFSLIRDQVLISVSRSTLRIVCTNLDRGST